jgi:hypothetical protein
MLQVIVPIKDYLGDTFFFQGPATEERGLGELVSRSIDIILIAALILSLIYLLVGGISWITSGGKPEQLESARNRITHAIIGLAVALGSWALWALIVRHFFGLTIIR